MRTYNEIMCVCLKVLESIILLRLREESLKQFTLIEEIERVKQLTLHDVVNKSQDAAVNKKKKYIVNNKRVPISKNTYCSKVKTY